MPQTIEAEILEINGGPTPPPSSGAARDMPDRTWEAMRGKIVRLDRRWWPLWLLLGLIFGIFVVVVGLIIAVAWCLGRMVRRIRGVFNAVAKSPGGGLAGPGR